MNDIADIAVIGGGPAGICAAIYSDRLGLKTSLFEKSYILGGQVNNTWSVENYLGFPEIKGQELAELYTKHLSGYGVNLVQSEVISLIKENGSFTIKTPERGFSARAVIAATGSRARLLEIPGEKELYGRGVSYCGTCDGPLFRKKTVAVIGGGDTAVEEAIFLARYASRVIFIHRRNTLRAAKIAQERLFKIGNIEFRWDTIPLEITGETAVESILLKNLKTGETASEKAEGVFIFVGLIPITSYLEGLGVLDGAGYVRTGDDMKTAVPGLFAAGDLRVKTLRQIATAVSDGAVAAYAASKYIEGI